MPKYLFQVTYTAEGLKGLLKDGGSARAEQVHNAIAAAGGKLEAMYFAFGQTDVFLIEDLPDNAVAAAMSMLSTSLGLASTTCTVLLTPEEVDTATQAANKMLGGLTPPSS